MYSRLGDYIQVVKKKNEDKSISRLKGVSTSKQLIESVTNVEDVDISNYKVLKKGQFVYSSDTSRRGDKIALAFNNDQDCIVSSIYTVFEVIDESKLLPEFLFMFFNRKEFDRYARFHSWGSARETFDWEEMCDTQIPLLSIEKQRKYVDIYRGIRRNQKAYENSLDDLEHICTSYIKDQINKQKLEPLGDYIQECDNRNSDERIKNLKGVSTKKKLIESKANTSGVNFSNYKILQPGQFVYVADTSRRGDKIALAMNHGKTCIVSSIYTVFEVADTEALIPEFLYLFLQREEFDRYARFHSWGSARETFDWEEMCQVKIPVPSIEKQEAIVTIYNTLKKRRNIYQKLKGKVKPLCPVLMKGAIEELKEEKEKQAELV